MGIFHAVILGIIEGITEFLPVSSTAHLILASKAFSLADSSFLKTFEISIQVGAVLAVVVLYWNRLIKDWVLNRKIVAAFIPTAIVGGLLYPFIKGFLLGSSAVSLYAMFLGGIFIILFELWYKEEAVVKKNLEDISYPQALLIGCFQSVSVIPGVSRAAASILGGLSLGLSRRTIVEFSFLLAIPTIIGAAFFDLSQNISSFSGNEAMILLVGTIVSFLVAMAAIRFFIKFIKTNTFIIFGVYRIIISFVFWLTA
ncbi:MAG TPA: undecaprenyl-diphosphate phosphatase [Candidatus Paceibacterota bacterium]